MGPGGRHAPVYPKGQEKLSGEKKVFGQSWISIKEEKRNFRKQECHI